MKGDILKDKASKILKIHNQMEGGRVNWDQHWYECAKYLIPRKDDVYGYMVAGEKKGNTLYDSTGIIANELLASALHGMLTNPSIQWFDLTTGIDEIDKNENVRLWLQKAVKVIHQTLNNSNFQPEIHEVYIDQGALGTGILRIEEDDELDVRFHARPIYEHYIKENFKGFIDTVSRKLKEDGRQILQEYSLEMIKAQLTDHDIGKIHEMHDQEVIHLVLPLEDAKFHGIVPSGKQFPFPSFHVMKSNGILLKEGGFEEFPYAVPRWSKVTGESYGRGPGMKSLPDVKMINEMMKATIRGAQKVVDPPLQVPDDGMVMPLRTVPGGINYYRAGSADRIEPLITQARIDIGFEVMNDVRKRIREAFFIDQLQLNEGPQMTATEVLQRTEEKLRLMGPVLGRQHFELLKPLINRVFGILARKNKLPENPPQELKEIKLNVQYSSMIARAQRTSEIENLNRAMQAVGPIVQMDPSIMDNINGDEYLKYVGNIFNVPQELFNSEKEVASIRQSRQEQAQKQQQLQEQNIQADSMNKVAPALKQVQ